MSPRKPHRNDPCPCGSGEKHKRCCGLREAKSSHLIYWIGAAVAVGFTLFALQQRTPKQKDQPTHRGQAGEYDKETNMHWDPAHEHWHEGPPPPGK